MIQCDIYVTGRTSKTSFTKENIIEVDTYNKAAFPLKVFVESLAQITVFANTFSFSLININQNTGDSNFVQTFSHKLLSVNARQCNKFNIIYILHEKI